MQKNISCKFNKKILCVLILFITIYILLGLDSKFMIKSYGATYTYKSNYSNLPADFDTRYPGYRALLENMINNPEYSNWSFELYETGLEWNSVIDNEYTSTAKSLAPNTYPIAWLCPICKDNKDNGSWRCASKEAVEYMIDPRNSLNGNDVFQFLQLSNDVNITKEQVTNMANKIPYLSNQEVIDAIYEVANQDNINPLYIIGKIRQEQGEDGSVLCSGNGYYGQYVKCYNFFNIRAYGDTKEQVIINGLSYAQEMGWDTPVKSIRGGLKLIKTYIDIGQDTLYYQKYDVIGPSYYTNQYAQNVLDAQHIGEELRAAYSVAGLLNKSYVFKIPLYNNMPQTACINPTKLGKPAATGELAYINADSGLRLRSNVGYAGAEIDTLAKGQKLIIIERATETVDGIYWDKVYTHEGIGYMARGESNGGKTYLVVEGTTASEENKKYNISNTEIIIAPDTTISDIYGATTTSSILGTGIKIELNGTAYNLVILGDVSGDGKTSPADYVRVKNKIMGVTSMDAVTEKAADVNRDGKVSPADYVQIKNHIMNVKRINI